MGETLRSYMKRIKLIIFIFISSALFVACSTKLLEKKLSQKEIEAKQINSLRVIRPLLKSDEFPYMGCKEIEKIQVDKDKISGSPEFWYGFGDISLREIAATKENANIMILRHQSFGKIQRLMATLYNCEKVNDTKYVEDVGMCKASKSKLFKLNYPSEDLRKVGEEVIKQKIRYYAIANHYKTYGYKDIKYSFTNKEFIAKATFYKCL